MKNWESVGAWVHHILGIGVYLYDLLFVIGIGAAVLSFLVRHKPNTFLISVLLTTILFICAFVSLVNKAKRRLNFLNPDLAITHLTETYSAKILLSTFFERQMTVRAL